jgi:raffinose/stachyose/melibiose transport system permease protein
MNDADGTTLAPERARPGRLRRYRARRVPWGWVVPAAILAISFHYVSVAAGAWYAFTDWDGFTFAADFVGLDNFREIFRDEKARGALLHTLELGIAFVVAANTLGLLLALALNRSIKSRNFLRAAFFAPVVMSPIAVSFIWQYIFQFNGPLNEALGFFGLDSLQRAWIGDPTWALWTIFVVLVWQFSGLTMVMYLAGLQNIPEEIEEAAIVDGASPVYRFRRIILPLLAPAFTIALTYTMTLGLRVFAQVLAVTDGGPFYESETLATQVYKQTFAFGRFGYGAAFALVLTLVVAIVAITQLLVLRAREKRIQAA